MDTLTDRDRAILALVEPSLRRGRELKQWYAQSSRGEAEWFQVGHSYNPDDRMEGFFGVAPVRGGRLPVMAAIQDLFFDRPRLDPGAAEKADEQDVARLREQIREFALKYLRVVEYHRREPAPDRLADPAPAPLDRLSWNPEPTRPEDGFSFAQLYYKRKDTGKIGRFSEETQNTILDLRRIGREFEWVVLRSRLLNAALSFSPLGSGSLDLTMPMKELTYLVVDESFVWDRTNPAPGTLGHYGVGYAMIHYGTPPWPFAYGPGHFDAGIQLNEFRIDEAGQCRVRLSFVVSRPSRMLNILGFDPMFDGIRLMNLATLGWASRALDINVDRICKNILFAHSSMYLDVVGAATRTYRLVPDWLDEGAIPGWVRDK